MKLIRDEAGQTVVFTGLLMCVLMGFMALAVDVGLLSRAQRRLQIAADAGAVAAGLASEYGMTVTGCGVGVSNVQCAAIKAANANGVKDATQVTVTQPPDLRKPTRGPLTSKSSSSSLTRRYLWAHSPACSMAVRIRTITP